MELWWLFTRQTVSVKEESKVRECITLMVKRNFRHLPVVNQDHQIIGIISAQDIIDSISALSLDPEIKGYNEESFFKLLNSSIKEIVTKEPLCIFYKSYLIEALKIMSDNNKGALPIIDEKRKLRGIITLRDFISLLGSNVNPIGLKVKEFYTKNPIYIEPTERLLTAIHVMSKNKIRRIIVGHSNLLSDTQGMISNKDILRYLDFGLGYKLISVSELLQTKVSKVMGNPLATVDIDDDVRMACFTMNTLGIGGLGVLNNQRIDGIITERDVVTKLYKVKNLEMESLMTPSEDLSLRPPW